jgi:thiamine monophosphate kinase
VIRAADVPVAPGATIEDALSSGEEAELVCVGPEDKMIHAGVRPIGLMTIDAAVRVVGSDGRDLELEARGYDHFA